jgi:hypothetical protein
MGSVQVVTESLRAGDRALVVGSVKQVVHQLASQPQLQLDEAATVPQLDGQDSGSVLEDEEFRLTGPAFRIHQSEHTECLVTLLRHSDHAISVADRFRATSGLREQLGPAPWRWRCGRRRSGRAGPRLQIAEAVLGCGDQSGEPVHDLRDAGRAAPRCGHNAEGLVHHAAPLQVGHALEEVAVCNSRLRVGHGRPVSRRSCRGARSDRETTPRSRLLVLLRRRSLACRERNHGHGKRSSLDAHVRCGVVPPRFSGDRADSFRDVQGHVLPPRCSEAKVEGKADNGHGPVP